MSVCPEKLEWMYSNKLSRGAIESLVNEGGTYKQTITQPDLCLEPSIKTPTTSKGKMIDQTGSVDDKGLVIEQSLHRPRICHDQPYK